MAAEKHPNDATREGVSYHQDSSSPSPSRLEYAKPGVVDNTDEDEEFTYEEQRKIVHRIDRRLVVILGTMSRSSLRWTLLNRTQVSCIVSVSSTEAICLTL